MENEKIFTVESINALKDTCKRIIEYLNENIDGDLSFSQLLLLGINIKEFIENPIVKNSGILK